MSDDNYDQRLALLMATTAALASEGWRDLDTAPHDGSEVEIRVVHFMAPACADEPNYGGFIQAARAHWIDHINGGFTWHGLAGTPSHWRPLTTKQHNE